MGHLNSNIGACNFYCFVKKTKQQKNFDLYIGLAVQGASSLHEGMLTRVFQAPMSFFDTTPVGRILNRFSKDMASVDEVLPMVNCYVCVMF